MKNRAVFLDRDGVINRLVYHQEAGVLDSPFTLEQFELMPRAAKAVKLINRMRFKAVLVSNQPGIAKGHFDLNTLGKMEKRMKKGLAKEDAQIDKAYYCFHHPKEGRGKYKKACNCRKPKPGLILKASREMSVDLKRSYMVGDSITDMEAGRKAGCVTILIGNHKCDLCRLLTKHKVKPDYIASDLYNAVKLITKSNEA
jgi:D-glycero-D-manno-heptose 1,7-bisphosphate phosphatase